MTEHTHAPWRVLCLFSDKNMFKHTTDLVDHISREKVQSKCQWLTESCIIVCQPHINRIGQKNDNIIRASAPFTVNFYPTFVTFKVSQRPRQKQQKNKEKTQP